MFKKTRDRIVRETAEAVLAALDQRQADGKKPDLAAVGDFYEKTLGGMSNFLSGAGDLALRGAASLMGQRGGRAKAAKRRAAMPAANGRVACRLCVNEMVRNPTVAEIMEHRRHEHSGSEQPKIQAGFDTGPAEPAANNDRTEFGN